MAPPEDSPAVHAAPARSAGASAGADGALSERTPLLPKLGPAHIAAPNAAATATDLEADAAAVSAAPPPQRHGKTARAAGGAVIAEAVLLLKACIPVILAYALQNSLQTASVLVAGQLSPEALAVSAFSYMFASATGWLVAFGGTTAIDTLASASFTGAANPHALGIILQRALLVLLALYALVALLWVFSEPLFLALRQEPWLARDACRFLRVLAPLGLGYVYFEAMKKYLQAQQAMRAGTYVLLLVAPVNVALNVLCVHTLGLGLLGAPLATGISYWLAFLLILAYAWRYVPSARHSWGGWSRACLNPRATLTFARLALLGIVMLGAEWWAFEIVALLAGTLGTVPLAAQSIVMTLDQIFATVPLGLAVATSARVGNLLGSRDPRAARRAAHTAVGIAVVFGATVLVLLLATKDVIGALFNDDPDVINLTAKVMPFVALFQIADSLASTNSGTLRGSGRQLVGALTNLSVYYACALPIGAYLTFHGWGLQGLWIGLCIALYLVGFILWAVVATTKWDIQVILAFKRMEADHAPDPPDVNAPSHE